jgi:hypothetical protein
MEDYSTPRANIDRAERIARDDLEVAAKRKLKRK